MAEAQKEIRENTKKSQKLFKHSGWWLMLLLVFIAELFAYTAVRVDAIQAEYRINEAKSMGKKLESYKKDLIVEYERLKAPERISYIARTYLHLTLPAPEQVVYLDRGGVEEFRGETP